MNYYGLNIPEPTSDECSGHVVLAQNKTKIVYAIWYPQMGGYVGRAATIFDKSWIQHKNGGAEGGCIDVLVWHDGEFPFNGEGGRNPVELHHCDGKQFIQFGKFLDNINTGNKVEVE